MNAETRSQAYALQHGETMSQINAFLAGSEKKVGLPIDSAKFAQGMVEGLRND